MHPKMENNQTRFSKIEFTYKKFETMDLFHTIISQEKGTNHLRTSKRHAPQLVPISKVNRMCLMCTHQDYHS